MSHRPPLRLGVAVEHASGAVTRWAPDEVAPNVPTDLTFTTSIPGGFSTAQVTLARRIDRDYVDIRAFDTIRVHGPGGEVAWEGRVQQAPRSHDAGSTIEVGAVGWSAHLRDDPSLVAVFVDRDLTRWREPSGERFVYRASNGQALNSAFMLSIGAEGIVLRLDADRAVPNSHYGEVWYEAPRGVNIARVEYQGTESGGVNMDLILASSDTEQQAAQNSVTADLNGFRQAWQLPTPRRYVWFRDTPTQQVNKSARVVRIREVMVAGNHGVPLQLQADDLSGVYVHDVIRWIIGNHAPKLAVGEVVDATDFIVPHLIFPEPVTAEEAIERVNAWHQYEWGVYEGRRFFWRPTGENGRAWEARLSDGARLDLEGPSAEDAYNGVLVRFQQPDGTSRVVGPPGATADATFDSLADTSPDNPVNEHQLGRRWAVLDLSIPATVNSARRIGEVYLEAHSRPKRRGTLRVSGWIRHPKAGWRPVWAVRAGDYVRITDHSGDIPRRIIETSYSHADRTLTMTLDSGSDQIDAILERIGAALVRVLGPQ